MIRVTDTLSLADEEIEESFVRASGPGGQNVNKLSTAVRLRFDVRRSPSLPEPVRARLERLAGQRLTQDGVLVINAQRFRSQDRNRSDAREKLIRLIAAATEEETIRRPTRPSAGARQRRLTDKTRRAALKRLRGPEQGE